MLLAQELRRAYAEQDPVAFDQALGAFIEAATPRRRPPSSARPGLGPAFGHPGGRAGVDLDESPGHAKRLGAADGG
jgi:hypothetical protein